MAMFSVLITKSYFKVNFNITLKDKIHCLSTCDLIFQKQALQVSYHLSFKERKEERTNGTETNLLVPA